MKGGMGEYTNLVIAPVFPPVKDRMNIFSMIKQSFSEFGEDEGPRLAAALAYYSIFAMAPLVLIAIFIAGLFFSPGQATNTVQSTLAGVVGPSAANTLMGIASNRAVGSGGIWATVLSVLALLVGATGVFVALQQSLNQIWDVEPKKSGIWEAIQNRLLSFLMVFAIGLLLVVAMLASTALALVGGFFSNILPGGSAVWFVLEFIVSWAIIAALFALVFKILPDVNLPWHVVWVGAILTGFLFNIGKLLIGLYLGHTSVASTYGAAGGLVLILVFIYYSGLIFFFGAELTQVYARRTGERITPARGAHWINQEKKEKQPQEPKTVVWKPGQVSPQSIPATGARPAGEVFTSSRGYLVETHPEPPRGFFALVAASLVTLIGGVLAIFRLTGSGKKS